MKLGYILDKCEKNNKQYMTSTIDEDYFIHYKSKEYYYEINRNGNKLICYGYLFDIRKPELSVKETLIELLDSDSYMHDLAYLNGQYVIIYKNNENILFTTDAMSLLPSYINDELDIITNLGNEIKDEKYYNSRLVLNLTKKKFIRIEVENNIEGIKDIALSYLSDQHKFFINKNIVIPYTSNHFIKSVLAILKNSLSKKSIILSNPQSEVDLKFSKSIAKDFDMNILDSYENLNQKELIIVRNKLINFGPPNIKEDKSDYNMIVKDILFDDLSSVQKNYEYDIMTRRRSRAESLAKYGLLFDPLNVHIIYQNLVSSSEKPKAFSEFIQSELLPMLDFYDFYKNDDLKNINKNLESKIHLLEMQRITAHNEQFLLETELSPFKVSKNLDGKIKPNSIIVYPASQKINKDEVFKIKYYNLKEGFLYIKSTYKNEKNGRTIEVKINNNKYTIDQLFEGILINSKDIVEITITYKADRNSLPWQKAGTLIIQEK